MLVGFATCDLLTARVKRPKVLMVIFGITGTVGALATWMLRRVAILNVTGVDFVHRCWSKTSAEVKTKKVALTVCQRNVDIARAEHQNVEFFKPCKKGMLSKTIMLSYTSTIMLAVMLKKYMR